MRKTLGIIAAPYGFGPTSKAIAIASFFPAHAKPTFLSEGPPLELARSSAAFGDCLKLPFNAAPNVAEDALAEFDILLFVNSTRFITPSLAEKLSVILVETLAWLRDGPPDCHSYLRAFFAQNFFNRSFPEEIANLENFREVGAILPQEYPKRTRSVYTANLAEKRPLVQCGGLFSTQMIGGSAEFFLSQAIDLARRIEPPPRIIVPEHLRRFALDKATTEIEIVATTPLSISDHLLRSEYVVATSGIEFTYEAMFLGVPVLFLPPFNASQACQLDFHRTANPISVSFDCLNADVPSGHSRMHAWTARIQTSGMQGAWHSQFNRVSNYLDSFAGKKKTDVLTALCRQQKSLLSSLGMSGGQMIAEYCLNELGGIQ